MLWLLRALSAGPAKKRVASIVCVALALGHVLGLVHEGLVSHAVCAEHGEAIHARHGAAPAAAPALALSAAAAGVSLTADAREASAGHAHEHCACLSQRRERLVLAPAIVAVHGLQFSKVTLPSGRDSALAGGIRPVLIAPKGSPPV